MVMEVRINSKETIMPSSPTPPLLRRFNLSIIDQMTPSIYTSLVFYYPMNNNILSSHGNRQNTIETITSKLKLSYSQTLTEFYPFSGRVIDNLYVECNDAGALYFESRVNCPLAEFLNKPDLIALDNLVPLKPVPTVPDHEAVQIAVQINVFECGGIAIGVSKLHKIIDFGLLGTFVKRWASISSSSRDKPEHVSLDYEEAYSLFPQRSTLPANASNYSIVLFTSNSCVGRYVLSPDSVSKLKAKATSQAVPNPTTVQALSAFILKRVMRTGCAKSSSTNSALISHPVNIRRRMKPELPEYAIGNIVLKAYTHVDDIESKTEADLAALLRKTFSGFNSDYVGRFQGDEGFSAIEERLEEIGQLHEKSMPNLYSSVTDWTKLNLYGVDFGWGEPVWVSSGCMSSAPIRNVAVLNQSNVKGGVEMWLMLDEDHRMTLEQDQEFLAYASINPSVI